MLNNSKSIGNSNDDFGALMTPSTREFSHMDSTLDLEAIIDAGLLNYGQPESPEDEDSSADSMVNTFDVAFDVVMEEIITTNTDGLLPPPRISPPSTTWTPNWSIHEDRLVKAGRADGLNWDALSGHMVGRSAEDCERRFNQLLVINRHRPTNYDGTRICGGGWTFAEDSLIVSLRADSVGWDKAALQLTGRLSWECENRLDELVRLALECKSSNIYWRKEEDDLLIKLKGEQKDWKTLAEHFPGRSVTACRFHCERLMKNKDQCTEEAIGAGESV